MTLLLGALTAGATAVVARTPDDLAGCEVAFVTAEVAAAALDACDGEVLAVSTAPLSGRLSGLPALVLDAGLELPAHGDVPSVRPPSSWSVELAGSAVDALPDLGLGTADRVLTVLAPSTYDGLVLGLLGPLAAGSALVLAPEPVADAALAAERVTASVGLDVPGARRLG